MSQKIDFIASLLNSKKLNPSQKERVFALTSNELDKIQNLQEELLTQVKDVQRKLDSINVNEKDNEVDKGRTGKGNKPLNILIHDSQFVFSILSEFRKNTALKFTTHAWDKTDFLKNFNTFSEKLNNEKKEIKFTQLFHHNRHLYTLLNYFLFSPKEIINDENIKFGWESNSGVYIKIGWQYPKDLLKNWCEKHYDNSEGINKKLPFEYRIPDDLKPPKKVNGKEIIYFEDVVNVFKTEIQFRGAENNFRVNVEYFLNKHNLKSENIESINGLDFYTYTKGILEAINIIFEMFYKNNESLKEVNFHVLKFKDSIVLQITQLNSYPKKEFAISNPNKFFAGNFVSVINHIFSLCDYSVISKFNKSECYEVKILEQGTEAEADGNNIKEIITPFRVLPINPEAVKGFTHQFRFYL
jgi:hypothetical protein